MNAQTDRGYAVVHPDDVAHNYADSNVPGEFRRLTDALEGDQLAVTLIRIPAHSDFEQRTGHHHQEIEEVYLVTRGTLTMRFFDAIETVRAPRCRPRRRRDASLASKRARPRRRDAGDLAPTRPIRTRRSSTISGRPRPAPARHVIERPSFGRPRASPKPRRRSGERCRDGPPAFTCALWSPPWSSSRPRVDASERSCAGRKPVVADLE
jgi:hypothetical protein